MRLPDWLAVFVLIQAGALMVAGLFVMLRALWAALIEGRG